MKGNLEKQRFLRGRKKNPNIISVIFRNRMHLQNNMYIEKHIPEKS